MAAQTFPPISGRIPIFEEGLEDLIRTGLASGHLAFGADNTWAVEDAEFIYVAVGTPPLPPPQMIITEPVIECEPETSHAAVAMIHPATTPLQKIVPAG